jgi:hypothetical protein
MIWLIAARAAAAQDWLPIPPDDLAMKDNPANPGADAMILYRENRIDVRHAYEGDSIEEYERIKIFTQEGEKAAHIEIPVFPGVTDVSFAAGRTIHPDGSIVKFDGKVLQSTIEKRSGFKFLAKTFTLPDVQPGSIVEYKVRIQGREGIIHDEFWPVTLELFTREAHFKFIPSTAPGMPRAFYRTIGLPADAELKEQIDGSYVMVLRNILPIVDEPLMLPETALSARVDFYYENTDFASTEPTASYWNHRAKKWSGELDHFVDKKGFLSQEVAKIIGPSDSPETKLRKIYGRVQQVRNLGEEDYRMEKEKKAENLKPDSNVEDVLSRGYATGRQMNYLFAGLARAAGFEATEIRVVPRSIQFFSPAQEDEWQLVTNIVWVRAGTQEFFLDPASRAYPFGVLPWSESSAGGVKVGDQGGEGITTPRPVSSDATTVRRADLDVSADGSIAGKLQIDFAGQEGALLRQENRKEDETGRTKVLEDKIKAWLPVGSTFEITKIANWENVEQPVHAEGDVKIPSLNSTAARRMIMPLEVFQMWQMSSFASEKRVNKVYFHYPYEETDDIKLRLPAGYGVESIPPERKLNSGPMSYELSAMQQGNSVELKRHLVVGGILFSKDAYPALRQFFGSVKTNDSAQIVLENAHSAGNQ